MEAAVEVALPAAFQVARLMGSAEGFGGGGSVVVREVPRQTEGACSSGVQKDETCVASGSTPAFWTKFSNSELCEEALRSSSLRPENVSKNNDSGNVNSPSLTIDLEDRRVLQKSNRIVKNSSGCTKRSGMVQMEVSKSRPGSRDVNGISSEIASSLASCNISEKTQMVKQRNSSNYRRGEKRNGKALKNRSDSFSLKNGFVGLNSAAGGNNFLGIYGLKPDVFDITKYVDELSLDDLLHGSYKHPSIAKDKGKKAANSNNNLLQSVRKACSILQTQKVPPAQKCAEVDTNCIRKIFAGSVTTASALDLSGRDQGESCATDPPSSDKAEESDDKIKTSNCIADLQLCQPKDILERLALPPPKDLDLLLSDASKVASSSKSGTDPRFGKAAPLRAGLAPFPWSNSFSGHNRLGADAVKSSSNRTTCHGRWVKIENSSIFQKGSADFLVDFETLKFDQSLVPKVSPKPEHPTNGAAPIERDLSSPGACSTFNVHADEDSPTYAAAQTLCGMATSPCAAVKSLKKPSNISFKACKLKSVEKSDKLFDAPKSAVRLINPVKVIDGFPSKKPRLSSDTRSAAQVSHSDSPRKGPPHWPASQSIRSPPRKLFRDSKTGTDNYRVNFVKTSPYTMKPPPSSSQQKLRKVVPMKWGRPEG